jgi:RND family efflux transporter MFP subunit
VALRRGVPIALGGLIVTGAGTSWALAGSSGPDYRTAVATVGSVDQLANFTGTVATTGRASAAFGVAGTVDKVSVAPGDKVAKGDVLATMNKDDLQAAVRAAKATLAEARATLENDSSSSSGSSSSGSSSSGSGSSASGSPRSGSTGAGQGGPDAPSGSGGTFTVNLSAPVAAVNTARKDATEALTAADAAMTAQGTACASVLADDSDEPTPTPTVTPKPGPTPDGSDVPSDNAADDPGSSDNGQQSLLDCVDALKSVQAAQAKVASAQSALDAADTAFSAAMNEAVKKLVAEASAAAQQAQASAVAAAKKAAAEATAAAKAAAEKAAATQQTANAARSGAGGTTAAEQEARIAVDNAAISAAEAALASAQEDVEDATLRAPVAGVVGAVPFTAGAAASASDAISLLGTNAVEVTINVPLATAEELAKGMAASITADGAAAPAHGTVNTIGVLPDSSSGTATYPVTILVPQPSSALADGATAAVSLTLKSATDAVTVPNSALTPTGSNGTSFVTLVQAGKAVRKTVTTGAVGETRTAVTDGLAAGDTVVLADADSDVPASSTTSTRTGFGGAGFGAGGTTFAVPAGGGTLSGGATRR